MNPLYLIAGLLVAAGAYVLYVYNSLATTKVRIRASIQEIGNQLKRQADLIPNIETSAKAYLKHEKDIIALLAEARKAVDKAQKTHDSKDAERASQLISTAIPAIRVAVESNPELKGAEVVTQLMDELRDTADKVMYSRRTMIDLTADYNTMLATFPSQLVANLFGFKPEKGITTPETGAHLEVSESDTKTPKVTL
jgi:LemA protein